MHNAFLNIGCYLLFMQQKQVQVPSTSAMPSHFSLDLVIFD